MDRDTVIRTDSEWEAAAEAYVQAKTDVELTAARLDEAKARLVRLASHAPEKGAGVSVSRYWKAGSVDNRKVPALAGIDLEQYRSAKREEVRVSIGK